MPTTKELICETAIRLFNEKGYDNVSLREIAKEAGTTIGNLTYHFQKKEDLIISIVNNLHNDFAYYFSTELKGLELLKDFLKSIENAKSNKTKLPFYYQNLNQLIVQSEAFYCIFKTFQKRVYDYYLSCFLVLQEDDILKSEIELQTFHILAYSFTELVTNWVIHSSPFSNDKLRPLAIDETLYTLIIPYLNSNYIDVYNKLISEKLDK